MSWKARGCWQEPICHECAHLEGQMYVELVEGELVDTAADEEEIVE